MILKKKHFISYDIIERVGFHLHQFFLLQSYGDSDKKCFDPFQSRL